jgi:hypothetical protein
MLENRRISGGFRHFETAQAARTNGRENRAALLDRAGLLC